MKVGDMMILLGALGLALAALSFRSQHVVSTMASYPVDTATAYSNGIYPLETERLPPPIVTHMSPTGSPLLLLPQAEPPAVVYHAVGRGGEGGEGGEVCRASLLSGLGTHVARRPVASGVGFVRKLEEEKEGKEGKEGRERVLAVLTRDWTLMAFDAECRLLWETHLVEHVEEWMSIRAAAVLVSSAQVVGEGGTVVVAGRMDGEEVMDERMEHTRVDLGGGEGGGGGGEGGRMAPDFDTAERVAALNHFVYYAVDAGSGRLVWSHTGASFHEEAHSAHYAPIPEEGSEDVYPEDAGWGDGGLHDGEHPWRSFRASVLASLPHRWGVREDTSLELDHYAKGRAVPHDAAGFESIHLESTAGLFLFGIADHDEAEHVRDPNVVVAHLERGVEVLHLRTGRTLCQIPLPPGASYTDVNGDGVINAARAEVRSHALGELECLGEVGVGTPEVGQLFNASLCPHHGEGMGSLERVARGGSASGGAGGVRSVPPLFLGVEDHVSRAQVVFFLSTGQAAVYDHKGKRVWSAYTNADWSLGWDEVSRLQARGAGDMLDLLSSAFVPLFSVVHPSALDPRPILVLGGYSDGVVVDARTGSVRASFPIPDISIAPVVVGDVDGDGVADLVVTTRSSYVVYSFGSSSSSILGGGHSFLRLVVAAVVVVILFVMVFVPLDRDYATPVVAEAVQLSRGGVGGGRTVFDRRRGVKKDL